MRGNRCSLSVFRGVIGLLAFIAGSAKAGSPYDTDDPEPTATGHWQIFAYAAGQGQGRNLNGTGGIDLAYGAAKNLQISTSLPFKVVQSAQTETGIGNIEIGTKYRFFHSDRTQVSIAAFPRLILPTADRRFGTGRVQVLLPVWGQKNVGPWQVFGGGGYTINPGAGNRDFWRGAVAVSRQIDERLSVGIEATRQGADSDGGAGVTGLGIGGTYSMRGPFTLLVSGGPRFNDNGGGTGYHFYAGILVSL